MRFPCVLLGLPRVEEVRGPTVQKEVRGPAVYVKAAARRHDGTLRAKLPAYSPR